MSDSGVKGFGEPILPVMKLNNFWALDGENSDTQWYCPPDVGAYQLVRLNVARPLGR